MYYPVELGIGAFAKAVASSLRHLVLPCGHPELPSNKEKATDPIGKNPWLCASGSVSPIVIFRLICESVMIFEPAGTDFSANPQDK